MSNNAAYAVPPQQVKTTPITSKSTLHFAAGLCSGLTSSILLQPADLLKTRVQQSHQTAALLPTIKTILSSSSPIQALWRGTLPSALRTGFGSALYFTILNTFRQGLAQNGSPAVLANGNNNNNNNNNTGKGNTLAAGTTTTTTSSSSSSSSALPKLSNSANLTTGGAARVAAGFVIMPFTVIKVRYESDYYAYRSLYGAGRDIVRTEGVRGLFSGFGATAVRDAPYAGLYVLLYEQLKRRLGSLSNPTAAANGHTPQTSSSSINFVSGALAAGLATAITNPFDAVKTRLQLMPGKYGNMLRAVNLMIREDGVRSLLGGLGLRMGRKALSSALAWTVYEELILRATAT